MIMNNLIYWTLKLHNWVVAQYSAGSTIDTLLMPCILTLHIRAGPSDGLWVSWSHHEQSGRRGAREEPRLLASDHQKWWQMRQIAEIVSPWWICRDGRHLIALWSLTAQDELSCGNFIWIMTITMNCWLIRSVCAGGSWQIGISSKLFMHSPGLP